MVGGPRNTTATKAFKDIITNFTVCRKHCPFNICRIDQNSKYIWVGNLSQPEVTTIVILSQETTHLKSAQNSEDIPTWLTSPIVE